MSLHNEVLANSTSAAAPESPPPPNPPASCRRRPPRRRAAYGPGRRTRGRERTVANFGIAAYTSLHESSPAARAPHSFWHYPSESPASRRAGVPRLGAGRLAAGRVGEYESHPLVHPHLLLWRPEPARYLGPEAGRSRRNSRRVPADRHARSRG